MSDQNSLGGAQHFYEWLIGILLTMTGLFTSLLIGIHRSAKRELRDEFKTELSTIRGEVDVMKEHMLELTGTMNECRRETCSQMGRLETQLVCMKELFENKVDNIIDRLDNPRRAPRRQTDPHDSTWA